MTRHRTGPEQRDKALHSPDDESKTDLEGLCRALLRADPDIKDIIQFGSSVYAPDLALDIDLLVTTAAKKDSDVYWDAVADWPVKVDIIVRESGQRIGDWIALGVLAAHKVLYGDGSTIEEARTAIARLMMRHVNVCSLPTDFWRMQAMRQMKYGGISSTVPPLIPSLMPLEVQL